MYSYELFGITGIPVFRASTPSDPPSNASPLAIGYVVAVEAEALAVDVRSDTRAQEQQIIDTREACDC
jgi:hypothetical protein